jgi:AcrR family transcriptional regulator
MIEKKPGSAERMKTPFSRSHQHEIKLQTILSEAARLFNYQGTRATTLGDIADSIGLTKTSLYYYARDKAELVYKCYLASCDAGDAIMAEAEQGAATGLDCLVNFVEIFFRHGDEIAQGRRPHAAMLIEIPTLTADRRKEIEARVDRHFETLLGFFRRGIDDGSIAECALVPSTQAFMSVVNWSYVWYGRTPMEERPATVRQLIDLIKSGISAGPYPLRDIDFPEIDARQLAGFDREEQNYLKRVAFLRAGSMSFNERGFAGTSLDDVADKLGVTKGAFYYHIRNKEDLLYQCFKRTLDLESEMLELADGAGRNGIEKIELVLRYLFNIQHNDEGPLIRYRSLPSMRPDHRLEILQKTEKISNRLGQFIRGGIKDGSIRDVDSNIIEKAIAGAVDAAPGIARRMQFSDNSKVSGEFLNLFFNGIAGTGEVK